MNKVEKFLRGRWNEFDIGIVIDGWECISDEIVDTRRSSPVHQYVVKSPEGELWQFLVVEDEYEWWFNNGVERVQPVEVTTVRYVRTDG